MPPIRSSSGRASKACDTCRKYKTRCYTSQTGQVACLRCTTLSQSCSLSDRIEGTAAFPEKYQGAAGRAEHNPNGNESDSREQHVSIDDRLARLERTVDTLLDRLDARFNDLLSSNNSQTRPVTTASASSVDGNTAPVFLLRDAATDAGVHSPDANRASSYSDVISTGLVPLATAHSLLELFHIHYGRWVKFPEDISTSALLSHVIKSPLLLCSIFLIAVRHTTQDLADRLAPKLFQEAMRLVSSSLLIVPQPFEFFQAVLILSLWSTTIGQVPLSVDSWLLTGYALQQCLASPDFVEVFRAPSNTPAARSRLDAWCLWNHLCLAHLQYCVGTRRQALLNQEQINHCVHLIESDNVTNYEARMVAEVNLYWIIYGKCCGSEVNLSETKLALQSWRQEWTTLFNKPRSQFLQMGFHFAHLLAYGQSIRSPTGPQTGTSAVIETIVTEMVNHSTIIINLAIETTDERTRHLTDHIYHIVTFSALTLCRLVHTYEEKLRAANHDVEALDNLVVKLADWLRSIGLPCHAAHMLAGILAAQFNKLRPTYVRPELACETDFSTFGQPSLPGDDGLLNSEFIGSEFFNIAIDATPWPQWGSMYADTEI